MLIGWVVVQHSIQIQFGMGELPVHLYNLNIYTKAFEMHTVSAFLHVIIFFYFEYS
jgi:hypothetical protein